MAANHIHKKNWMTIAWDTWCTLSIVGIWPRFIEPRLLHISHIEIPIPQLPTGLEGLRIAQFSDLHFNPGVSEHRLNKIRKKILAEKPDIIVFTGDFLCDSVLAEGDKLQRFLRSLSAPYGCFAVLGNHDYGEPISVNERGEYDIIRGNESFIKKGFKRLFGKLPLKGVTTERAKKVELNHRLLTLLTETPFQLLHNASRLVRIGDDGINICGLGEYMIGRCDPERAFEYYDPKYPGLILVHNPDGFPMLHSYPGNLVLSGHTHGAQVNLPYLSERLTLMEHPEYLRGLFKVHNKTLYVNRGLGSSLPFRWRAIPEISIFTLRGER
jgi:uncharacterized protein